MQERWNKEGKRRKPEGGGGGKKEKGKGVKLDYIGLSGYRIVKYRINHI